MMTNSGTIKNSALPLTVSNCPMPIPTITEINMMNEYNFSIKLIIFFSRPV